MQKSLADVPAGGSFKDHATAVAKCAVPLENIVNGHYSAILNGDDYLIECLSAYPSVIAVGDARVVMIGEASHGTHEFYHHRAEMTKQLIERHGFNCIAVEADWPDAYRANRLVIIFLLVFFFFLSIFQLM